MAADLILFGAGGHAKVVLEAVQGARPGIAVAIVDDAGGGGRTLLGRPVFPAREWMDEHAPGAAIFPSIGDNGARARLLERLTGLARTVDTIVDRRAILSPSAGIGRGVFLAPGAVVNAGARLADAVIVNTGASVDHDCVIGSAAHIAPGARLCGGVEIGARTLVGAGSTLIPGVRIGADVTIGAGSVVLRDVPGGARVAGNPARPIG
ncbi:MAG: acetyltransferase [Pseudomonadota bacterium]|nr:acetyltransferase [Pseudomonadota bacterium]